MSQLSLSDHITPFIFDNIPVRGAIVKLSHSLDVLFDGHQYQAKEKLLLAEFIAANVLMTSHLKLEGLISMQIKSKGKVQFISTECTHTLNYRALIRAEHWYDEDFATLFEDAVLAITLEPIQGQRYQGLVALEGGSLSDSLSHYFYQSEQLPTQFLLMATKQGVCGLMLQALPDSIKNGDDEWQRLQMLLSTLQVEEAMTLSTETILYRLFHEDKIKLFDQKVVNYSCGCSKARFERALLHLDHDNLSTMLEEDGQIETQCHFCLQKYVFDELDIQRLLQAGSHRSNH